MTAGCDRHCRRIRSRRDYWSHWQVRRPLDPAVRPTLTLLTQGPITPAAAIAKLRKHAEDDVLDQLLRTGQIHQVTLSAHRLRRNTYAWPVKNRERVDAVRAAVLAALNGGRPDAVTAAIISLLHRIGGMNAALAVNDESSAPGRRYRTADVGRTVRLTAEINLALTAAAGASRARLAPRADR